MKEYHVDMGGLRYCISGGMEQRKRIEDWMEHMTDKLQILVNAENHNLPMRVEVIKDAPLQREQAKRANAMYMETGRYLMPQ